jgi:hypothetical protein
MVEGAIAGMLRMVLCIVVESSYDEAPLMFIPVETFAQRFEMNSEKCYISYPGLYFTATGLQATVRRC